MPYLTSIMYKLLSLWYNIFPPKVKEPALKVAELEDYMEKLPFPALKYTEWGFIEVANTQLTYMLNLPKEQLGSAWWSNKKLWSDFCSGKITSYEEHVNHHKKVFLVIGHINGIGPYCSVQDITPIYKARRLLAMVSKGIK